jgi:alcohol dehydrogenase class IV
VSILETLSKNSRTSPRGGTWPTTALNTATPLRWTNGRDARSTLWVNFEFATAARIVFGAGRLKEIGGIAPRLGRRALVVIGKSAGAVQRVEPLLSMLTDAGVEYATFSVAGEPTIDVVRTGTQRARDEHCDFVIGFGGGSAIDTGKAIAVLLTNPGELLDYIEVIGKGTPFTKPSMPYVAIPTTAGTGSEVTRNAVLSSPEHRVKVSIRSPHMLPRVALIDPELTYDLPPQITASTGLDALTQLIEPFVSVKANPMTDAICREGLQRVARSLRRVYEHPDDTRAREDMSVAAMLSGMALANGALGAVHGFSGPLGGMFDAPHGALCAAVLPYAVEINERAVNERMRGSEVGKRFEEIKQLVGDLGELVQALKISRLRQYGVTPKDFPSIIEKAKAANSMKGNPVVLRDEELREILERSL